MSFRDFLLSELVMPSDTFLDLKKMYVKGGNRCFYIDQKGVIRPGMGSDERLNDSWKPYFELIGFTRSVRVHNIEPRTKVFKQFINAIRTIIPEIDDWDVEVTNLSHSDTGPRGTGKYYRKVAYYIKHSPTDVSNAFVPSKLYHGTSTELWFDGIKSRGLIPRLNLDITRTGSYGASAALSHGDRIYLSVHPDAACRRAAQQASTQHGGAPLIIEIDTSGLDLHRFTGDEDADRRYEQDKAYRDKSGLRDPGFAAVSASSMGTLGYRGAIPSMLLKPFLIAKMDGYKIVKWEIWNENTPRAEHPLTIAIKTNNLSKLADSPYVYALIDAGILAYNKEDYSHPVIRKPDDAEIRQLIRNSAWSVDAYHIIRDLNDWGQKGLKSLNYVSTTNIQEPELKTIVALLVANHIYYDEGGYLRFSSSFNIVPKVMNFAKQLHAHNMNLDKVMKLLPHLHKYQV